MSAKQKTILVMAAATVGQIYLAKVAKQNAAALGVPTLALSVLGVAVTYALA